MISKNQIKFVRSLEQKKQRQRQNAFVAEGPKVVGDLLAAGFRPTQLFATEEWVGAGHGVQPDVIVTPDELSRISFLQHPQQVLALFPIPSHPLPSPAADKLIIALDGIQDPGNLGTIIRIADWYGIDDIVCSVDTVDAWNPKVVQATMGSIARVRVTYTPLPEFLRQSPLPVCGTLLDGENIYAQQLPQQAIIVMGNEGNGISPEVRPLITRKLLIPQLRPGAESLNVAIATAITCSEFLRKSALNN